MATHTTHSTTDGAKKDVPAASKTTDATARTIEAEAIIRRNVYWSLGAGVVPFPIFDVVAITAVELKLLKQLADHYDVKFSEKIAKKIILSLISSIGVVGIGAVIGGSLAKLVPVIGTTLGFVTTPVLAGAFTNALGKVMMMHFEAGGTLLDFEPAAMRTYFMQEFEKAKETVSKIQHEKAASKPV